MESLDSSLFVVKCDINVCKISDLKNFKLSKISNKIFKKTFFVVIWENPKNHSFSGYGN